jgi:NAD(P)-dependent dehydrogenase (short-subunit alcohol dehydrogenase family)
MKKVVVFGASGAMGSEIAKYLSSKDYSLHLVGRDEGSIVPLSKELGASFTLGEVRDLDLFQRAADEAGESLHGLVYAVGTLNLKSLKRLSEEDFIDDFRINAAGAALAVQHLQPALLKNDGVSSVVLFSSIAAEQGFTFHASISMAKGAVRGLTLALAAELAPKIRVNAISPSLTESNMSAPMFENEKMVEAISKLHAMNRLGTPQDMAMLCEFLLSSKADWITGQIIGVDGGRSTLRIKS